MKIAVTGAFSYSGKYITQRLLNKGHTVITLTGHPNRKDPFNGKVDVFPLSFDDESTLTSHLEGVSVLYNTYWIRFDRKSITHDQAVINTRKLIRAAENAGVRRIVHVSITNPSSKSNLPYFKGKALNEKAITASKLSYAILRPTVLYGVEDILINNIAFLIRRFPIFAIPGNGNYQIQPIYVDDLAQLAVEAGERDDNFIKDVVGYDVFTFNQLVQLIANTIDRNVKVVHFNPELTLLFTKLLGLFIGDVLLTRDEMKGLMDGLLVSNEKPEGRTRFADWLEKHKHLLGMSYASELERHYSEL